MRLATGHRLALRIAFVVIALFVGAACSDVCNDDDGLDWFGPRLRRVDVPQTVTPGPPATPPVVGATATRPPVEYRYATIAPITAIFNPPSFTTTYSVKITGGIPEGITVEWSGPNCGAVLRQRTTLEGGHQDDHAETITFDWQHPHPPCASTTDHADVTVVARITEGGTTGRTPRLITICTYVGSESGVGPTCQLTSAATPTASPGSRPR